MVMAGARSLSVVLTLQDKFTRQMRVARAEVDKFGQTTSKHTKAIDEGFKKNEQSVTKFLMALRRNILAVTAVIGAMIGLTTMFVSATRDHARSVTVLDGALQAIGTSWAEQRNRIEDLLKVVGGSTGATEGTMIGALTTLIRETGNLDTAMKLLEPTFGLAARTGIPVADAATLIAEALKGDEGAVKKMEELGLNMDSGARAGGRLNAILEFTDGWATKNVDSVSKLQQKWDEFKLMMGEKLVPVIVELLDLLLQFAPAIEAFAIAAVAMIKIIVAPLLALQATIEAIKKLLGLDQEEDPESGFKFGGGDSGGNGASRTWETDPPELLPGGQIPWVPNDPWAGIGEQPGGIIGQGMNVTIVSNGDLDFERRVTSQLDSIYRSGWRPN